MQIDIKIDAATVANTERALGDLAHKAPKVIVRAINETTAEEKTSIAQQIYKRIMLSSARIKKDIRIEKASAQKMSGAVVLEHTKRIGLRQFGARQTRKGTSYKIGRDQPRKTAPHAFIATAKGGEHVFERKMIGGKRVGRLPVRRLMGISAKVAFEKSGLVEPQFRHAQMTFDKNLRQGVNAMSQGFVK